MTQTSIPIQDFHNRVKAYLEGQPVDGKPVTGDDIVAMVKENSETAFAYTRPLLPAAVLALAPCSIAAWNKDRLARLVADAPDIDTKKTLVAGMMQCAERASWSTDREDAVRMAERTVVHEGKYVTTLNDVVKQWTGDDELNPFVSSPAMPIHPLAGLNFQIDVGSSLFNFDAMVEKGSGLHEYWGYGYLFNARPAMSYLLPLGRSQAIGPEAAVNFGLGVIGGIRQFHPSTLEPTGEESSHFFTIRPEASAVWAHRFTDALSMAWKVGYGYETLLLYNGDGDRMPFTKHPHTIHFGLDATIAKHFRIAALAVFNTALFSYGPMDFLKEWELGVMFGYGGTQYHP